MRVLRRHPAWFIHSEPMTSNCGFKGQLVGCCPCCHPHGQRGKHETLEQNSFPLAFLIDSLPASVDASSSSRQDLPEQWSCTRRAERTLARHECICIVLEHAFLSFMTPLHCPAEPAIDLAPGTLGDACSPAVVRPCSEQRHMCDRRSCSDADLPAQSSGQGAKRYPLARVFW